MTKTKTEDASPVVPKVPTLSAMPDYLVARATKASARFADRKVNSMSLQKTWLDHVRMTNHMRISNVPAVEIGHPIRVRYNDDGSVKLKANGEPATELQPALKREIKDTADAMEFTMRQNAKRHFLENQEDYRAMLKLEAELTAPIVVQEDADTLVAQAAKVEADRIEAERVAEAELALTAFRSGAYIEATPDADAKATPDAEKVAA